MSSKAEKLILKKTHVTGSAKMQKILELECIIDGCSAEEINAALKKLISEGQIYVCRIEHYIKKV